MCNPRRIRVTATRQLNEAWQQEVSRSVGLQERVIGEARVRQALDTSLGGPALMALEAVLSAKESGWQETEEGYRYNVEGGYVIYLPDDRALEIVAVLEDEVQAEGEASEVLEGQVAEEITAEGEGRYYDDGYAGRTREVGEREAQTAAQTKAEQHAQMRLAQIQQEAEQAASVGIEANARRQAEARLQQAVQQRQTELAENAQQHLETVGLRCRQAFHQVLAQAYRDAILAYAKRNGASHVHCQEEGDVVEIEFSLTR